MANGFRVSRREFIRKTGVTYGTAGLFYSLPSKTSPNERVRFGQVGCGGMGITNMLYMLEQGAECVAVCDPDDQHANETAQKVAGKGHRRPETCRDFRRILDRSDVDAVVVSTPDHWHAIIALQACMAGKDVFVEKPASHTVREGRAMVRAARKYNRIMQVGTQQRSGEHFISAKAFLDSGQLGKVALAKVWISWRRESLGFPPDESPPGHVDYDLWLGPAPKRPFNKNRFHYNWRWFWDYGGGRQADWAIHLMDIVHWFMGVDAPLAVSSSGGKLLLNENTDTPDTQVTIFEYPGFICTFENREGNGMVVEDQYHGMMFYGENGTLLITRSGWEVYSEGKRIPYPPKGGGSEMMAAHIRQFIDCVKSRKMPNTDVETGHRSTTACRLANISYLLRRRIHWDREREEIPDDPDANKLLEKEYRAPWVLPRI